jgi:hypothetical protein
MLQDSRFFVVRTKSRANRLYLPSYTNHDDFLLCLLSFLGGLQPFVVGIYPNPPEWSNSNTSDLVPKDVTHPRADIALVNA